MYGEEMIPGIKVLPHVDAVIHHGGNNTMIETLYYGKPMIVMPFCYDLWHDNAQRIVEKGFGLKLDPLRCTKENVNKAIQQILNDGELLKRLKEILRLQKQAKSNKLTDYIEKIM